MWPKAQQSKSGHAVVRMSPSLTYGFDPVPRPRQVKKDRCPDWTPSSLQEQKAFVENAFKTFKRVLLDEAFTPSKFYPRDAKYEPTLEHDAVLMQHIAIQEIPDLVTSDEGTQREWYQLCLLEDGSCTITVKSPLGINWAFVTLLQQFYRHSSDSSYIYTQLAPFDIVDQPCFSHRGLNLDISRGYSKPSDIKRTLDGMWLTKMNRLHLHATDSHAWPLEIPSMPELAEKGAYASTDIWTAEQLKDVQSYANSLGIEVFVEIDMPGHTASIHHSHPDLVLAYNKQPWQEYALQPPAGQLKLNSEAVSTFVKHLFDDLLPRIAPYSTSFHAGGDELNRKCYLLEPEIHSEEKDVLKPYLQRFFNQVILHIQEHNLIPVFWEEILLEWELQLPPNARFQSWKSHDSVSKIAEKGYQVIFGPSSHWYFDGGLGSWIDPDPQNPDTPVKPPFMDWCGPYKNWRMVYSYDPFQGVSQHLHHLLVGGEMNLWTEGVDSISLDFVLWPRLAAGAEVLWSGPGKVSEDVTRRLAEMRERLVKHGIRSCVVQTEWSLQNEGYSQL